MLKYDRKKKKLSIPRKLIPTVHFQSVWMSVSLKVEKQMHLVKVWLPFLEAAEGFRPPLPSRGDKNLSLLRSNAENSGQPLPGTENWSLNPLWSWFSEVDWTPGPKGQFH